MRIYENCPYSTDSPLFTAWVNGYKEGIEVVMNSYRELELLKNTLGKKLKRREK